LCTIVDREKTAYTFIQTVSPAEVGAT